MTSKKKSSSNKTKTKTPRRFYIDLATNMAVAGLTTRHMGNSRFTLKGWQDYLVSCNAAEHVAAGYIAHLDELPSYLHAEVLMMTMARLRDYRHSPEKAAEMINAARERRTRKMLNEPRFGGLEPIRGGQVPADTSGTLGDLESTGRAATGPSVGA